MKQFSTESDESNGNETKQTSPQAQTSFANGSTATAASLTNVSKNPAAFQPNSYYENLIDLRERDPKAFACLAPSTKISLGYYIQQKREANA